MHSCYVDDEGQFSGIPGKGLVKELTVLLAPHSSHWRKRETTRLKLVAQMGHEKPGPWGILLHGHHRQVIPGNQNNQVHDHLSPASGSTASEAPNPNSNDRNSQQLVAAPTARTVGDGQSALLLRLDLATPVAMFAAKYQQQQQCSSDYVADVSARTKST